VRDFAPHYRDRRDLHRSFAHVRYASKSRRVARASIEVSGTGVPVFSRYPLATSLNRRNVSM
jgi:hypothetical protein